MTDSDISTAQPDIILALDCASGTCSAAVARGGRVVCSVDTDTDKTHSLTLLPSVEAAFSLSGLTMTDITDIAVTVGPGSFTGLKIGVSTAKGLAFTHSLSCCAVSSMTALAYGSPEFEGLVCTSFDARRGMIYNALFRIHDGKPVRLCGDRQSSAAEVAEELTALAGENERILLCGDGSQLILPLLGERKGVAFNTGGVKASAIIAAVMNGDCVRLSAAALAPEYLRPSQAERERAEKSANR